MCCSAGASFAVGSYLIGAGVLSLQYVRAPRQWLPLRGLKRGASPAQMRAD